MPSHYNYKQNLFSKSFSISSSFIKVISALLCTLVVDPFKDKLIIKSLQMENIHFSQDLDFPAVSKAIILTSR